MVTSTETRLSHCANSSGYIHYVDVRDSRVRRIREMSVWLTGGTWGQSVVTSAGILLCHHVNKQCYGRRYFRNQRKRTSGTEWVLPVYTNRQLSSEIPEALFDKQPIRYTRKAWADWDGGYMIQDLGRSQLSRDGLTLTWAHPAWGYHAVLMMCLVWEESINVMVWL